MSGFHLGAASKFGLQPIHQAGGGFSMFDEALRDNLKNISLGLGLTVLIIGAALAVAFW